MRRLTQTGQTKRSEPRIDEPQEPDTWLDKPGVPKPKLADEEEQGVTMDYDELLKAWRKGKVGQPPTIKDG